MVAVEHVLDLENAGNFDRHTSVLALSCNCWEAPSAKSDPGSSQAASRGVESPPKSRFGKTPLGIRRMSGNGEDISKVY